MVKFDKEKMFKEIIKQINSMIPNELSITYFCDKWNTIWCTEYGKKDEDGHTIPKEAACRKCIKESITPELFE